MIVKYPFRFPYVKALGFGEENNFFFCYSRKQFFTYLCAHNN
ncbi:hypothetical protein HMPREF2533_03136 [Bacteroides fragilis]|nr:hypothetical protein M074_2705 [Bacteroides fragilis str. DS-166]EYA08948.1 hypothetical protein M130_2811 [Bacteroides fragilis str. S6R6]KXU43534.1 hypothetical protein HMPREF2530_03136 [Bacteroides fragilis]KXU43657.1 hypothetical protein HMPREF2533_03136 [Bacteroides fragilis]